MSSASPDIRAAATPRQSITSLSNAAGASAYGASTSSNGPAEANKSVPRNKSFASASPSSLLTATVSTGITNAPSPRRWSSSSGSQTSRGGGTQESPSASDTPIPVGADRGKLGNVFAFFKSRTSSTQRTTITEERKIHDTLSLARQQVERLTHEISTLRQQLENANRELSARQSQIEVLDGTNAHCQKLLKRNADLEMLVADIQDEADNQLQALRQELRNLKQTIMSKEHDISYLRDELTTKNRNCCREAVCKEVAKIQEMAQELFKKEEELAQLTRDLQLTRVELDSATEKLDLKRQEVEQLRQEKLSSFNSLSDVSEEMKRLLRETADLEKQLTDARHAKLTGEESLRKTLTLTESELASKEAEIGRLLTELDQLKNTTKDMHDQIRHLTSEKTNLQTRVNELESKLDGYSNLLSQLKESEERRRLEQTHNEETLNRLRSQLASYKDVHQQATELLLRNSELERILDQHLQNLPAVDNSQLKELRHQLREKDSRIIKLESRLAEAVTNADLNEKTIRTLNRKLQATEIAATGLYSAPLDAEKRAATIQEAVEAAIQQTAADSERVIADLKRKYDILVGDIRKSHQSDMEQKEREIEARIRAAVSEKTRDFLKTLQEKEEEWHRAQRLRDSDFDRMCTEKEEELKRYRAAFEASLVANYDGKLKKIADDKDKEVQEMRERYEKKLAQAQKEAEENVRNVERKYRDMINAKDAEIGRLTATADTLAESYRLLEVSMHDKVREMAQEEANMMLVHRESALMEKLTKGQLDFDQKRAALQEEMDEKIKSIRQEEKALRDALMKEKDEIQAQANRRIQDMQNSIDRVISSATQDLANELEAVKSKLTEVTSERETSRMTERELQKEINKLNSIIQERDAAISSLTRELNTSEAQNKKEIESLKAAVNLQMAAKESYASNSSEWSKLVKRNLDLEQLLADVSERHHDELRERQSEITKLKRQLQQTELRLTQLTRDNESLKGDLRRHSLKPQGDSDLLNAQLRDLSSDLAATQAEKARLGKELDRTKIRLSELEQDLSRAFSGNPDRQKYQRDLIGKLTKLQDIMASVHRAAASDSPRQNELASARHEAEQKRLAAEIDFLRSQMAARQTRIDTLESSLLQLREDLQRDPKSATSDEVMTRLREVQSERNTFAEECRLLQEQLQRQAATIATEIERRDAQLTSLKSTNERVSALLSRNTELENEVKNMFQDMKSKLAVPSFPIGISHQADISIQHEITETLSVFENEFYTRSHQYESDLRSLAKTIEDRDAEIDRLQNELRSLRTHLERVYNEEIASHKLAFETEKSRLMRENESLKNSRTMLESELQSLRVELSAAKAFDAERIDEMINDLTRKMKDQQLMLAEIQDEKDAEIRRIESKLEASRAAQRHLEEEISRVSLDLNQKEGEIVELSTDLQRLMKENEYLSEEALGTARASEEDWSQLMQTLETLFDKLVTSQSHANSLIMTLQALLKEQEQSLEEMARSQEAVSQARVRMTRLVNSNDLQDDFGGVLNMRTNIISTTKKARESLSQTQGKEAAQVAQLRANIKSKEEALEQFKQKSRQRDQQLADLRAKLTSLQLHDGLAQDISDRHDTMSMTQQAISNILSSQGEIGALNDGLQSIRKDLEEIKGLRRDIQNRRSLQTVNRHTKEHSSYLRHDPSKQDLSRVSTTQSTTRTATIESFTILNHTSPDVQSIEHSPQSTVSPRQALSETNKRKIVSMDVDDNVKKMKH